MVTHADTHFSELYANMCKVVSNHPKTPKFENPEGGKPIDFRRLLLNKCQEEFEKGSKVGDVMGSCYVDLFAKCS